MSRGHFDGTSVQKRLDNLANKTVNGRIATPREIAQTIYFLADNEQSSFMTGQALVVDRRRDRQAEHGIKMSFKETLKNTLPDPLLSVLKNGRDSIQRLPDDIQASTHPWRREVNARLRPLHNIYQGKRCFIIGNGPSLKNTDMRKLRGEYTFGMNRIYLMFPELGFETSFFVSINDLVIGAVRCGYPKVEHSKVHRLARAPMAAAGREDVLPAYVLHRPQIRHRHHQAPVGRRHGHLRGPCRWLITLGFSKVILIGVDHSFAHQGQTQHQPWFPRGDDPNHFNPAYFGKGFRWQLPDLDTSEVGYAMARQAYEADGRRVLDATVGGKLTIFPKVEYDSLFD